MECRYESQVFSRVSSRCRSSGFGQCGQCGDGFDRLEPRRRAITTVAGSGVSPTFNLGGVACSACINTGSFLIVEAGGTTQPILPSPFLIFSNTFAVGGFEAPAGSFLDIFITAQGLTTPLGNLPILSDLTENILSGGFTTVLETFLSSTNALYSGTLLSSQAFNDIGSVALLSAPTDTGPGPYSVTAHYRINNVTGAAGVASSTIGALAVPGPIVGAGLPALLAACFGLVAFARRRWNIATA